jgi:hypothetical protein
MFIKVRVRLCAEEEPQALLALTVIFPPVVPAVALIEFVVEDPDHDAGKVHVYDVAPLTVEMLYVLAEPEQKKLLPLIAPGVAGVLIKVTDSVLTEEEPHPLLAVTVISPPEDPAVVLIEVVVDEPVQLPGNVQV